MKRHILILAWLLAFALLIGCSDRSTSPQSDSLKLAGAWDTVSSTSGGAVYETAPGSIYWFFDDQGNFCSKMRNAYGDYGSAFCGRVSAADMTLAEGLADTIVRTWKLVLCGESDTLRAELVEAHVPAADSWLLVRVQTAVPADCFCE